MIILGWNRLCMHLQSGKFLDVNQKNEKMANNTGGIPWKRIQLVEKLRTHLVSAVKAPMRLPMTKEIVVTSSNPIVQRDSAIHQYSFWELIERNTKV